jgi:hypothetical protein
MTEGCSVVGLFEGLTLGEAVGLEIVGDNVGRVDGDVVGITVGVKLGTEVVGAKLSKLNCPLDISLLLFLKATVTDEVFGRFILKGISFSLVFGWPHV